MGYPLSHDFIVTASHLPVRVLRPSGARPGPTVVATETGDGRSPLATIAPRGGGRRDGGPAGPGRKGFLRRGRGEETKFRRAEPRGIFLSRAVTRPAPCPPPALILFRKGAAQAREGDS